MSPTVTLKDVQAKARGDSEALLAANGQDKQKPGQAQSVWQIILLPVERVDASPYQPRLSFDPQEMADLVASVRVHGVQQPIIARTCPADQAALKSANENGQRNGSRPKGVRYQLIAGERRLRACREAGRKVIPAILRDDLSDAQAAELALLENIQRSNLSIIEEAIGYKCLMLEFRLKEERIAKKVGKSVQTIKESIKLLALPQDVQTLLAEKKLSAAHGHELLALAPFERLCVLVAQTAARDHLTATSLSTTPLPNVHQLKSQGLVKELDHRTAFSWTEECARCPHGAYVRSGYSSYCLQPLEWQRKQEVAIELKKQEAARVMEEARQEGRTTVEASRLPAGSYRDLRYATLPSGCSAGCPCRSEASDPGDPMRKVPLCLDPKRYSELVQAERQAHEAARRQRFTGLWSEAKEVLCQEQENGDRHKMAALLAVPVLGGHFARYADPGAREALVRQIGRELGVLLPWETLLDFQSEEAEVLALLQEVEPDQLLVFTACLLLAQEASEAIRFTGPTPCLDFVLGRSAASQPELAESEAEAEESECERADFDSEAAEFEDDPEANQEGDEDEELFSGADFRSESDADDEDDDHLPFPANPPETTLTAAD